MSRRVSVARGESRHWRSNRRIAFRRSASRGLRQQLNISTHTMGAQARRPHGRPRPGHRLRACLSGPPRAATRLFPADPQPAPRGRAVLRPLRVRPLGGALDPPLPARAGLCAGVRGRHRDRGRGALFRAGGEGLQRRTAGLAALRVCGRVVGQRPLAAGRQRCGRRLARAVGTGRGAAAAERRASVAAGRPRRLPGRVGGFLRSAGLGLFDQPDRRAQAGAAAAHPSGLRVRGPGLDGAGRGRKCT